MKTSNKLIIIALSLGLVISASAESVASIEDVDSSSKSKIFDGVYNKFPNATVVKRTQDESFTTADIEGTIKTVKSESLSLLNSVNTLVTMKKNPMDGQVEAAFNGGDDTKIGPDGKVIISAMTQIRSNVADAAKALQLDFALYAEKDTKALAELTKQIDDLDKKIPVANTGLTLGSIEIPVIGTSRLQVFPITKTNKDGNVTTVTNAGNVRTYCGLYLKDDQLQNFKSKNYCAAVVWSNSNTRVSDVHPSATIDTYFIGFSEAYVPGEVNTVTIEWNTQPKRSVKATLEFYNILADKVNGENDLKTMLFETIIISGNGTKYPGKNALTME